MPFVQDQQFAQQAVAAYGKYHSTFRSDTGQVEAQLFERGNWLIAYVSFADGMDANDVTDPWIGKLQGYAVERGFADRLKIVYT